MTVASLAHSNIVRSNRSVYRANVGREKKTQRFAVSILLFVIFTCGFLYVFVTTNIATKDYKIRNLSQQVSELESINKNFQVEVSNLKSVNILEARGSELQMVKAQKVEYVSLPRASAILIK